MNGWRLSLNTSQSKVTEAIKLIFSSVSFAVNHSELIDMGRMFRVALALLGLGGFCVLVLWRFCAEENARGVQEWTATQENLKKIGESYDFTDLIPPTIPDSQNLAAIPLLKAEIGAEGVNSFQSLALTKALSNLATSNNSFPQTGNWRKAEPTDMIPLKKYLSDRYQQVFGHANANLGPLEQIDALCPAINQLRAAALTRKMVRFNRDYTTQPPYNRALFPITQLMSLAKVLNLHAIAALSENKPDVAFNDIELSLHLSEGVAREPVLISGLVSNAAVAIQISSIWEGLHRHAWNAEQINELERQLHDFDFISDYQLCVRGEATGFFAQTNDWMRDHRTIASEVLFGPVIQLITGAEDTFSEPDKRPSSVEKFVGWLVPRGWFDMTKARGVSLYYQAARELANPKAHRIDAERARRFKRKIQLLSRYDLPDILLQISAQSVIGSVSKFAEGQFRADAASIACALEKYRLKNGGYPTSLGELPANEIPGDPISGGPYYYKLLPNKGYLLYSVGWNGTDEGGTLAYLPDLPKSIDWENGDWVWPTP